MLRQSDARGKGVRAMAQEGPDAVTAVRAIVAALGEYACEQRKDALVAWVEAALAPTGGRLFAGYVRRKEEAPDG